MLKLDWEGGETSLWVAGAVAAAMFAYALVARLRWRALPVIAPPGVPTQAPDCMVVIPARNEAAVIARAVSSFPPDTVIVVDDHSEDATAEAARKAGAGVLPAPPVPRLGSGKSNACAAGARALESRWILFTDADTRFAPGFLAAAVSGAEALEAAMLSIYLEPEYATFAESLLVPYARALFFCGAGAGRNPQAMFSGQCVLALREPYLFMGSHGAVVSHPVEEVKLTAAAQRHRLRVAVARSGDLGYARMYTGWNGICRGIERQAARFMMVSPWIGASIVAAVLSMMLWLPALIWLAADRRWPAFAILALLPSILLRPWYRNWGIALLSPLAIYGMLPVAARALVSAVLGRPIVWKGRRVGTVS